MRASIVALVLVLVACDPPAEDDRPASPPYADAYVACDYDLQIVAPRAQLHYDANLVAEAIATAWSATPADLTCFAVDPVGAVVTGTPEKTGTPSPDGTLLTWGLQLAPGQRYELTITDGASCTQTVEFFTSP